MARSKIVEATEPRRPPFVSRFNPDGNERLTASVGMILVVLALVELATLLFGLQHELHLHVIVGLMLLPPIGVKLLSTGWRFARYYTRNEAYRVKGPPQVLLRLLAPLLVLFTVLLFGSGVALGLVHGEALHVARRIHGPAAFLWTVTLGIHVLAYLPRATRAIAGDLRARTRSDAAGAARRAGVLLAAIALGFAVGVGTLPVQRAWLHLPSGHHDRHGRFARRR